MVQSLGLSYSTGTDWQVHFVPGTRVSIIQPLPLGSWTVIGGISLELKEPEEGVQHFKLNQSMLWGQPNRGPGVHIVGTDKKISTFRMLGGP